MNLKDLVGIHKLSGVDVTTKNITQHSYGESNVIRFVLDNITYEVIENPDDGYRSFCEELEICNEKISNLFPPQKVIGVMKGSNNIIQFFDVVTAGLVLEIGTDESDCYYPCCIMEYLPENLACNVGR